MSKARLARLRPRPTLGNRGASHFGCSKYRPKAWECAARAQSVNDPQRRAELLRFSGMWLSLTEPGGGSSITAGGASGCACRSVPTGSGRHRSGTYGTESLVQDTNDRSHLHRIYRYDSRKTTGISLQSIRRRGTIPKACASNSRQIRFNPPAPTLRPQILPITPRPNPQ